MNRSFCGLPPHWRLVPVGPDKAPRLCNWPERAVPADAVDILRSWLARWPDGALALVTGPESGVLVVDVDSPVGHDTDGEAALGALGEELGPLPETVEASTPSGGRHLFFAWPRGVERIPSRSLRPGVDVKASRGCVVLPTGDHTPGRSWIRPPGDPAALPLPWRARLLPPPPRVRLQQPRAFDRCHSPGADDAYVRAALDSARARIAEAPQGTRHLTLFRETASLARLTDRGLDPVEAEQLLVEAALLAGLPVDEARRTVRDALRRGAR